MENYYQEELDKISYMYNLNLDEEKILLSFYSSFREKTNGCTFIFTENYFIFKMKEKHGHQYYRKYPQKFLDIKDINMYLKKTIPSYRFIVNGMMKCKDLQYMYEEQYNVLTKKKVLELL